MSRRGFQRKISNVRESSIPRNWDWSPSSNGRGAFDTNAVRAPSPCSNLRELRRARTHKMAWEVDDIETIVAALRARGVVFQEYDVPGLTTRNGVADIAGNYPSKGVGERGAWFRDSEGNLLGLGQPVR
jgi:hypothetical protein